MKKILLSAAAFILMSTAVNAGNSIVTPNRLTLADIIAPCGGYVEVMDGRGRVVYTEMYISNTTSSIDCLNEIIRFSRGIQEEWAQAILTGQFGYNNIIMWESINFPTNIIHDEYSVSNDFIAYLQCLRSKQAD